VRDDLPQAMRETAGRLDPDVVRLAAGGVSRGTRMRRLERVVQVLGSALAVAVVFAAVVLFGAHRTAGAGAGAGAGSGAGGGGGGANQSAVSSGGGPPVASLPGTPTATAPATGTGTTPGLTDTPSFTGTPQISDTELISALKSCFQGTGVTGSSFLARGSDFVAPTNAIPLGDIVVSAQLSSQSNIGSIGIVISGRQGVVSGPGIPQAIGDGSTVYVSQIPASTDGRQADRMTLEVTLVRPDGSSLSAIETNSPNDKSAAAPGAPLLLTADQVSTLLDSSVWDAAIAAAEALPGPGLSGSSGQVRTSTTSSQ
jgi:hypothetical protein